jgi:hypothetical protein
MPVKLSSEDRVRGISIPSGEHHAHQPTSKPVYYVKFGTVLFDVWGDAELAASIQAAVRR